MACTCDPIVRCEAEIEEPSRSPRASQPAGQSRAEMRDPALDTKENKIEEENWLRKVSL